MVFFFESLPPKTYVFLDFFRTFIQCTFDNRTANYDRDTDNLVLSNVVKLCMYIEKKAHTSLCNVENPFTFAIFSQSELLLHRDCCEVIQALKDQ